MCVCRRGRGYPLQNDSVTLTIEKLVLIPVIWVGVTPVIPEINVVSPLTNMLTHGDDSVSVLVLLTEWVPGQLQLP